MRKLTFVLAGIAIMMLAGCVYMPGGTDLDSVARSAQLSNITTGDGTFENYTATGHFTGTEVGIAVGIPGIGKIKELYPMQSNEALLGKIADDAKADGADAMINVTPHKEWYSGMPLFIIGLYVDKCQGTGIELNQ